MNVGLEDIAVQESPRGKIARSQFVAIESLTLLTGGGDPHYAYGLSSALVSLGVEIDLIGSDEFAVPAFQDNPAIRFLNLRGSVDSKASGKAKVIRILKYYARLLRYALSAKPKIFHVLWNNKFEWFDRTLLLSYYKTLGKRIVLTAHNVNAGKRDGSDSWVNRITLRIQYGLADCIFAHTERMARELQDEFGVPATKICLIPYGINNAVPNTSLTPAAARTQLGIAADERVLLFFGRINPYKGLEQLIAAFQLLCSRSERYRLIIAGRPEGSDGYCSSLLERLEGAVPAERIVLATDFVPDDAIEVYFKAADALVLPYRHIYQSGVLFLGQSFGLPVLASDVGSFKEEIVDGQTGFIFRPEDAGDLVQAIDSYFASDLYRDLAMRRSDIRRDAIARHSWSTVGLMTLARYEKLVPKRRTSMVSRE